MPPALGRWLMLLAVAACGCDKTPEPVGSARGTPTAPVRASAAAEPPTNGFEPAAELPAEWRLPLGWRWLTSIKPGFTVAFPGLPTVDTLPLGGQRLVVRTERAEYAVGVAPERDEAPRYRREVTAQGWKIVADRALAGGAQAIDADNGKLITRTRLVPAGEHTFMVMVTSAGADGADAGTFLDSFRPSGVLESRAVRFTPGGFTVVAPARMSEWEERSADPPLRGLAGLVDGAQLSASFGDLGVTAVAAGARGVLERGLLASLGQLGGATIARDDAPFHGKPSIRVQHRGANGVHVTRRLLLVGERLFDVAVYSPGGVKPSWADAFVDSLVVDR